MTLNTQLKQKLFLAKTEFIQNGVVFFSDTDIALVEYANPTTEELIDHLVDAIETSYDDADNGTTLDLMGMTIEEFAKNLVESEDEMKNNGIEWTIYAKNQERTDDLVTWVVN